MTSTVQEALRIQMEEKQAVLAPEGLMGSWKHCIEAHSAIPCLHTEGTTPRSP